MATQFTPCPACGAVGEVGSNCQFCGTTIILKEGATSSTERVPHVRTVTPQQYAEKISIYQNVEGCINSYNLMYVSIGDEEGLINLNGDLIHPLQHEYYIYVISPTVLFLSRRTFSHYYYRNGGKKSIKDVYKESNKEETFKKWWESFRTRFTYYAPCIKEYGVLLNLETMEKFENVHYHSWGRHNYFIEGKGYIDLKNFTIILSALEDIRKKTTINQKLLVQIKNYMHEVKANPEYGKYWYIKLYDVGEIEFYIKNNKLREDGYQLPLEHGVSLVAWGYNADKKFKNCKLFDLFEECQYHDEDIKCHNINFSFDAESLCVAIQYLAECYGCPSDKIKLEAEPFGSPNIKDTISDTGTDGLSSDGGPWSDPKQWLIAGILGIIWILYCILS